MLSSSVPGARLVACALTVVVLAGCTGVRLPSADESAPQPLVVQPAPTPGRRGMYLLQRTEPFSHLDPQRDADPDAQAFARAFLQRSLTGYAPGARSAVAPDLAVALGRHDRTYRTWSYTLRAGATFEDGSYVTARDVRYGVGRLFARELSDAGLDGVRRVLAVPADYPGPYAARPAQRAAFERAVKVSRDGRTITFHLVRPMRDFDRLAALPAFGPVPVALDTRSRYDERPIATGPYRLASPASNAAVVLVPNVAWMPRADPLRTQDAARVVVLFGDSHLPSHPS